MRRKLNGITVRIQPTDRTLRRLHALTQAALEKGGEDQVRIVGAVGKILLECLDETYDAIGRDAALMSSLNRLEISYGYEG